MPNAPVFDPYELDVMFHPLLAPPTMLKDSLIAKVMRTPVWVSGSAKNNSDRENCVFAAGAITSAPASVTYLPCEGGQRTRGIFDEGLDEVIRVAVSTFRSVQDFHVLAGHGVDQRSELFFRFVGQRQRRLIDLERVMLHVELMKLP